MQTGFIAVGIGLMADPEVMSLAAETAEQAGFHSIWAPEHIVLLDQYASRYPYSPDGKFPSPTMQVEILDPFAALTFIAAQTKTIRVGTGICLVPERNPLTTAKEVATLDKLSGGRFDFGVGVGWLEEEFTALGVPWARRAARTREYLQVMKKLWTEEETSFEGEFCSFPSVRSYPKPVQQPHPPIIFGGESEPALRRVGEVGDGWFGMNVSVDEAPAKIGRIKDYARAAGRDPDALQFAISPGMGAPLTRDDIKRAQDAEVGQLIVGLFPADRGAVKDDIARLAEQVVEPAASL